jgi:hypothetical protein
VISGKKVNDNTPTTEILECSKSAVESFRYDSAIFDPGVKQIPENEQLMRAIFYTIPEGEEPVLFCPFCCTIVQTEVSIRHEVDA